MPPMRKRRDKISRSITKTDETAHRGDITLIACYHGWDKVTGICSKCGHINFTIARKNRVIKNV